MFGNLQIQLHRALHIYIVREMATYKQNRGSFYWHGIQFIPAWISDYNHYKIWDELTYPIPHFNGSLWLRAFHPKPCWARDYWSTLELKLIHVSGLGMKQTLGLFVLIANILPAHKQVSRTWNIMVRVSIYTNSMTLFNSFFLIYQNIFDVLISHF